MRLFLPLAVLAQLALFAASCSSGGNSASLPAQEMPMQAQGTARVPMQAQALLSSAPHFTVTKLPAGFVPSAVMRGGRIPGSFGKNAAIYYQGSIRNLGTYGSESAAAAFVNRWGDAVGGAGPIDGVPGTGRALLFSHGTVQDLGRLPDGDPYNSSAASVISDNGAIYGESSYPGDLGCPQLVKFVPGQKPTALLPSGSFPFQGQGNIEDITPWGEFTVDRCFGDAPYGPLAALGLGTTIDWKFNGRAAAATAINDRGDFAGFIGSGAWDALFQTHWRGFLQISGTRQVLPLLGGYNDMRVTALNNSDEMIGTLDCDAASPCSGPGTAFLFENGTEYDLANLLPGFARGSTFLIPGLANNGSFVIEKFATSGSSYYLVTPSTS